MATHFYYNGHTYELEPAKLSWGDAAANAVALTWDDDDAWGVSVQSYLAIIGSAEENAAILKQVKKSLPDGQSSAADGGNADYLWIGGSDVASEGDWIWTATNTALASGYQNWGAIEPDDSLGMQDYLGFSRESWPVDTGVLGVAGQWNDLNGSNQLWSIIEWDGIIGTELNERLAGTEGDDVIDGNAGNDVIRAFGGDDMIYMGDGDDKVYAGSGNNTVIAEIGKIDSDDGNDKVWSKEGDDFIAPGVGDDVVRAGDGNNFVIGGDGNDRIFTGAGDDTINLDGYYIEDGAEGAGDDIIKTGAGNDFIVGGKGADVIWGGSGNDTFVFDNLAVDGFDMIKDFHAGTDGGVTDTLLFDSDVFEALADGIEATFFVKGRGMTGPSMNETGIDDYLIFDTSSGKLYYDADGNLSESAPVLIAIVKGKMADLNYEDFGVLL